MLTNLYEKQTELLAKKHGRATNHRSSFTNVLKGKIVKAQRMTQKQNEKNYVGPQSTYTSTLIQANVLKIKEKSNLLSKTTEKFSNVQTDISQKRRQTINQNTQETSMDTITQSSFKLKTNECDDITPLSLIKNPFKLNTFGNESVIQSGCMTDQCYYQKQLEIKVQILKKERDQLWDSINGIVRENNLLKETLQTINLKKSSLSSQNTQTQIKLSVQTSFQTDQIQLTQQNFQTDQNTNISEGFQTDLINIATANIQTYMSNDQLELIQLRYQKMIKERSELFQFCETLYLQDISEQLSECLNMKDALSEYLSIKIDGLIKQFDSQKAMLNKMYEQYYYKLKRNEQELLQRNQKLLIDLQEIKSSNKKLHENVQFLERKISNLQESNQILNQQLVEGEYYIVNYKKQAQLIQQSLVSEKSCWEQKKKTYSNLLAASHKTINNLMNQMKEFEGLASLTYSKYLKVQKKEHLIDNDI